MALTRHHMIPSSRAKDFPKLNLNDPKNIKVVEGDVHEAWHAMFNNRTPYEVMKILIMLMEKKDNQLRSTFGYWRVFKHQTYAEAVNTVFHDWTPPITFYNPEKLPKLPF